MAYWNFLHEPIIFNSFLYTSQFPLLFHLLARLKKAGYVNVLPRPKATRVDWKNRGLAPSVTGSRARRGSVTPLTFNAGRTRDAVRTPLAFSVAGCARTRSMTMTCGRTRGILSASSSPVIVGDSVHARRILARADLDYGTAITTQCSPAIFHDARGRRAISYIVCMYNVGSARGRARLGAH